MRQLPWFSKTNNQCKNQSSWFSWWMWWKHVRLWTCPTPNQSKQWNCLENSLSKLPSLFASCYLIRENEGDEDLIMLLLPQMLGEGTWTKRRLSHLMNMLSMSKPRLWTPWRIWNWNDLFQVFVEQTALFVPANNVIGLIYRENQSRLTHQSNSCWHLEAFSNRWCPKMATFQQKLMTLTFEKV